MTKQERLLEKYLEANGSKRIFLSLRPEKDNNIIKKEPVNRCEVRFNNSKTEDFIEFLDISESFYDNMVEEFHYKK